jgi:arylsulfatase
MTERPNIVLILTDQHRGDCLGIAGHPVLQTPNLDFLARGGTLFRRGYSEAPSCIPARRSLMSGQSPEAHGMVGFQGGVPWDPEHTLAGDLAAAGYHCGMVGKLHLWPHRKLFGFHRVILAESTRGGDNDYLDWLQRSGGDWPPDRWAMAHGVSPNGWMARPNHLPETHTHTFWCVSQSIEFVAKRDPTKPFFLNLSFIDPHPPLTPPSHYFDRYARKELPPPVIGDWAPRFDEPTKGLDTEGFDNRKSGRLDDDAMHTYRAGYFGTIEHVDNQIGRLIQYLRDARLFDNTFFLFTSDHGEMLGDHHKFQKGLPFEGSARVPFLARAPRGMGLAHEVVSDAPVGLQDVMPTLLDAAGVPVPEQCTGRSVLPLMRGQSRREAGWRETLHGEHSPQFEGWDGMHYLTDGQTKYCWFTQSGQELLFDLETDPGETHNLLAGVDGAELGGVWRRRLIEQLRNRPEGFTDGERLIAGRPHPKLIPGRGLTVAQTQGEG